MAMLALTAGQAFAQRCLPQMKGIEVKVGMADGVYNGKKSCKAGYYAGLGLSSYTKGGDKWTYGAEYLQVNLPYRETSVPIAQMTGEFGYSYNFLSDNSKTVLFYIGGTALAGYACHQSQGAGYAQGCQQFGAENFAEKRFLCHQLAIKLVLAILVLLYPLFQRRQHRRNGQCHDAAGLWCIDACVLCHRLLHF